MYVSVVKTIVPITTLLHPDLYKKKRILANEIKIVNEHFLLCCMKVWRDRRNNSIGSLRSSSGNTNTYTHCFISASEATSIFLKILSHKPKGTQIYSPGRFPLVTRVIEGLRLCLWNYQIFDIKELIKRHPVEYTIQEKAAGQCYFKPRLPDI